MYSYILHFSFCCALLCCTSYIFAQKTTIISTNIAEDKPKSIENIKIRKSRKINAIPELLHLPIHLFKLKNQKFQNLHIESVAYGKHKRQKMLICESKTVSPYQNEIIFFIHGGGWSIGKPEQHLAMAELLTNAGYRVILPGYRLSKEVDFEAMNEDIQIAFKTGITYLQKMKGIDNFKVVVGGASAGCSLGALLVFDKDVQIKHKIPSHIFAGFFSLAGVLSLDEMPQTKGLKRYAGEKGQATFISASPVNHIDGQIQVPVLCIHGAKDGLVAAETAQRFMNTLCLHQCDKSEFYLIDGGSHIGAATQWCYNRRKDYGQKAIILRWLHQLKKSA